MALGVGSGLLDMVVVARSIRAAPIQKQQVGAGTNPVGTNGDKCGDKFKLPGV
jgi:hypothetical protein